ncbi:MAG: transglycosylase domain-containing protein [Clostridia bacterium]|nr:transglycosylase domain-containing protein [Clostridia bacterium]
MKKAAIIISSILGAISTIVLALFIYYFSVTANVRLNPDKLNDSVQNVSVFDVRGQEIDLPQLKKCASFSALPSYVPNAFVSVEDKRFYTHNGFDTKRIGKAVLRNISSFSFREGASTISQQLIKNTHLSGEKTLTRKLKEMKLTRALEKRYSKEEILSLYLNSIYFGHGAFGIEEAASFYFQKTAETLTPAESATLAALVQSPNRYSPFRDGEKCLKRRNFVLGLMKEQGYISASEYDKAVSEPLPLAPNAESASGSSYLSLVFEELSTLFPDEKPDDSTLKIYTYYEPELQKSIESYEVETDYSACVLDNLSHGVKAYYSSVGRVKRLPASLMKPLLVYAPALEINAISPATPVSDERTDFGGYSPRNFDDKYEGYVSARYALSHSVNVPAVKILNVIGVDKGTEYLEKMGLSVESEDKSLALALGGMKEGYDLPELAFAYSTFATMGNYSPSRTIRKIESAAGKTLYEWKPTFTRVFSEDTAALMNDMLQTTVQEGTAKKLRSLDFQIAAKTGTGANSTGNIDAYTVSYTSEDVVAVWMGMRDNTPIKTTGGNGPAALALTLNRKLYKDHAPANFPLSDGVIKVAFDKEEYEKNHRILSADPTAPPITTLSELFRASAMPQEISTRFSRPTIQKPVISVKNGSVIIELCQTEYYDYVVKRKNNGKTVIIYEGKYRSKIVDNSVSAGGDYEYSVTPVYNGTEGETVILPSVHIQKQNSVPDDWWD